MRKSFKKALSLVLAAALAFSTPIATNATSADAAVTASKAVATGAAVTGSNVITESTEVDDVVANAAWWAGFSKYYQFTGNFDATFDIHMNEAGVSNWNNISTVFATDAERGGEGYAEYAVLRADQYGWGDAYANVTVVKDWFTADAENGIDAYVSGTEDVWAGWAALWNGADAQISIKRIGKDVNMTIVLSATDGKKYSVEYAMTYAIADTFRVFFAVDGSSITVDKFTVEAIQGKADALISDVAANIVGNELEVSYTQDVTPSAVTATVNDKVIATASAITVTDGVGRFAYVPEDGANVISITASKEPGAEGVYFDDTETITVNVKTVDGTLLYDNELATDFRVSKLADNYTISYGKVDGVEYDLVVKGADDKAVTVTDNVIKFADLVDGTKYTATLTATKAGYVAKVYTADFTYTAEKREEAGEGVKRTEINKIIGATDYSSGFWSIHESFKIEDKKEYTFVFENHGTGANNWNNFVLCFANQADFNNDTRGDSYKEYIVARADNYSWQGAYTNVSLSGKEVTFTNSITDPAAGSDESWAEWSSIIKDSDVTLKVIRSGAQIKVEATIVSQADKTKKIDWTMNLNAANEDGTDPNPLYLGFTVDGCYLNMKYVDEKASDVKLEESQDSDAAPSVKPGSKKNMMIKSISAKVGGKTISGEVNAPNATVEIKVGKGAWKKATMSGKKFSLKVAKLKIGTKITVKASAEGYSTAEQSKTLKGTMKLSAVKAKKGSKKITGKISVKKATVQVKVGKAKFKKAKVTGKKFTFKTKKLKKGTKIKIKVTKKNYKTVNKTVKVK